jgi:hypothetical protein
MDYVLTTLKDVEVQHVYDSFCNPHTVSFRNIGKKKRKKKGICKIYGYFVTNIGKDIIMCYNLSKKHYHSYMCVYVGSWGVLTLFKDPTIHQRSRS